MPVNVLIVDDSPFMRSILKNIIIKDNFKLAGEAGFGDDGYRDARDGRY
jgi:chemotaxis response regulator CheB